MNTYQKFKKALIEMYKDGELDKILKNTKGSEQRLVKRDIKTLEAFVEYYEAHDQNINSFSVMPLLMELKSVEVYKDALCYMSRYDDKEV